MDREAHLRRVINNQFGLVGVIDRNGILMEVDDRSLEIAQTHRDMSRCLECGCNDYISKPIEKSVLLKKIADLLA